MNQIELCAVGGFNEVGKNMTAVRFAGETVILDMGYNLQKLVDYQEETKNNREALTKEMLTKIGAIPLHSKVKSWRPQTKAILASHCHLDHIGAIPHLAPSYKAPIMGTAFTTEVLKNQARADRINIPNKIQALKPFKKLKLTKNIELELLETPHSTPQSAMIAIHTPKGVVLYTGDWKFDNTPTIGKAPNYQRLKELGKKGVKALITNALYSKEDIKTPSEGIARELLRDVLLNTENSNSAIITSCFASHIARIKSIIEFGRKLNRKVVILGRSFEKYLYSADDSMGLKLTKQAEIYSGTRNIGKAISRIEKRGPEKYLILCTGGQGENNSVLSKVMKGELNFKFYSEDHMIFSNKTIPVEPNVTNRKIMESHLKDLGVRIFKDVHVSGHCAREDIRELINLTNPENIIPFHGLNRMTQPACDLAVEMGYKRKRDIHQLHNGEKIIMR
jgi:ribonuclease J